METFSVDDFGRFNHIDAIDHEMNDDIVMSEVALSATGGQIANESLSAGSAMVRIEVLSFHPRVLRNVYLQTSAKADQSTVEERKARDKRKRCKRQKTDKETQLSTTFMATRLNNLHFAAIDRPSKVWVLLERYQIMSSNG